MSFTERSALLADYLVDFLFRLTILVESFLPDLLFMTTASTSSSASSEKRRRRRRRSSDSSTPSPQAVRFTLGALGLLVLMLLGSLGVIAASLAK